MAGNEVPPSNHTEPGGSPPVRPIGLMDVRDELPAEIRDPTFSTSVRGYDRHAVDQYVERVNRLIAELQVSGSPRAAVRHALDRVGEQTSGILQRARETAEEVIASAREEAEETTRRAKAEASDIVTAAERTAAEVTAGARAEAGEIVGTADTRAGEVLAQAADEAERTVSRAHADADGLRERSLEEVAAMREQAEARMHALEDELARLESARRALLTDARELAVTLAQVVADAEATDAPADTAEHEAERPGAAD